MALTFPYPLAFLSDLLRAGDVTWDVRRNDEMSGSGSGQFWAAEMARPLWTVAIDLRPYYQSHGREIDAKIRALGPNKPMLFADPTYRPARGTAPVSGVILGTIGTDRTSAAFTGLPAGYVLTTGDRLSIAYGSGRIYTAEIGETVAASGSGATSQVALFPPLPLNLSGALAVELARPVLKAIVPPGGHTPHTANLGGHASGASLTLLQKV